MLSRQALILGKTHWRVSIHAGQLTRLAMKAEGRTQSAKNSSTYMIMYSAVEQASYGECSLGVRTCIRLQVIISLAHSV